MTHKDVQLSKSYNLAQETLVVELAAFMGISTATLCYNGYLNLLPSSSMDTITTILLIVHLLCFLWPSDNWVWRMRRQTFFFLHLCDAASTCDDRWTNQQSIFQRDFYFRRQYAREKKMFEAGQGSLISEDVYFLNKIVSYRFHCIW
jgi:hypothetical protein